MPWPFKPYSLALDKTYRNVSFRIQGYVQEAYSDGFVSASEYQFMCYLALAPSALAHDLLANRESPLHRLSKKQVPDKGVGRAFVQLQYLFIYTLREVVSNQAELQISLGQPYSALLNKFAKVWGVEPEDLDSAVASMDEIAAENAVDGIRNPLAVYKTMVQKFREYLGNPSSGILDDLLDDSIFTDVAVRMGGHLRGRLTSLKEQISE